MNTFRKIVFWVGRHYILSAFFLILLAGFAAFAKTWRDRSDGQFSVPLARGKIVQSVYGIGTVTVTRSFQIKPGVTDHISALYVREGDRVKRGDRLVQLANTSWSAPFNGTVTYLPFKVGETVFPQTIIMTLMDLSDRYLVVTLEQQGALQVQRKQKVKISFDTLRDENFEGEVEAIYSNENSFLARIGVENLPERVLPGMTADVAIEIRAKDDVLLVPVAALDRGQVWVKRSRRMPEPVQVKTGIVDRSQAEVVEGDLKPGDRVLIRNKLAP